MPHATTHPSSWGAALKRRRLGLDEAFNATREGEQETPAPAPAKKAPAKKTAAKKAPAKKAAG